MSHADPFAADRFSAEPHAWPLHDPEIAQLLEELLRSGGWGRYDGPYGERLIAKIADCFQVPFVLPCSSGTIAVELALRGCGVRPGDEVIVSAYDFPGNFRAIEVIGARPVLVDIEPDTWCVDVQQVAAAFGPNTRAVLCSHLHGGLAPMPQLRQFADERGIALVEDVCQSPGAQIAHRVAGTWGDVGVLSFGGSKLLTAGRGGALVTKRQDIFQRAKIFSERGNLAYPLSELQAAVLLPQFDKLALRNSLRAANAERLIDLLADLDALQPVRDWRRVTGNSPGLYKMGWRVEGAGESARDRVSAAAREQGIALDAGFRGFGSRSEKRCRHVGSLTHAKRAAERTLVLHHPVLLASAETIHDLSRVIRRLFD